MAEAGPIVVKLVLDTSELDAAIEKLKARCLDCGRADGSCDRTL